MTAVNSAFPYPSSDAPDSKLATAIEQAVTLLQAGKLVAFPTETVYGLGADATNPAAIEKIFIAKGRPNNHPVIVHLSHWQQLKLWAKVEHPALPILAAHFWPGPLTLILPCTEQVSPLITGGQPTIGIRIPSHPVAQALLQAFGKGIAAPSANRFGRLSSTQATHVQQALGTSVDMILEGGACECGIESTIIDLSSNQPRLVRPGVIPVSTLSNLLGQSITVLTPNDTIRAPGRVLSHYAPQSRLQLVTAEALAPLALKLANQGEKVATIAFTESPISHPLVLWTVLPCEPVAYAHELYTRLHELDKDAPSAILVVEPPRTETWLGVCDRLDKAAYPLPLTSVGLTSKGSNNDD